MAWVESGKDSKGPFWLVRWRDQNGGRSKTVRPVHGGKKAADRWLAFGLQEEARRNDPLSTIATDDVTLSSLLNRWVEEHASEWAGITEETRRGVINNHIPSKLMRRPIRHIQVRDIHNLLRAKSRTMSGGSVHRMRSILKLAWEWAEREGYTDANPVTPTKLPKRAQENVDDAGEPVDPDMVLTPAEISQIADAIDPHFKLFVHTLGATGMRIGEACALQVKHLDAVRGYLTVEQALDSSGSKFHRQDDGLKSTKNRRARRVPIAAWLVEELVELTEGRAQDDYIFTMKRGSRLDPNNFRARYWAAAIDACGGFPGKYSHPHQLRHTVATELLRAGLPHKAIIKSMGWSSTKMLTDRYAGVTDDDQDAIRNAQKPPAI